MPDIKGLHIEPTNICTLKCAGCARTRFLNQWPQHWQNHSLSIDILMTFIDIDLEGCEVNLCGNYGDPIYHPELALMIKNLKAKGATIAIVTNGSYRKSEWWQGLCKELDGDDRIVFSIDGLPGTFTQYRENADWSSIEVGIKTCVEAGVYTVWKYIPFRYNQSDIDQAEALSNQLGMSKFFLDASDRFDEITQHLRPDLSMLKSRWQQQQALKQNPQERVEVDPKCHQGKDHFISADGHYSPCCYIADHRFYHKTFWGKEKSAFDIHKSSLKEILQRHAIVQFYQNIPKNPPLVCQYNCPK